MRAGTCLTNLFCAKDTNDVTSCVCVCVCEGQGEGNAAQKFHLNSFNRENSSQKGAFVCSTSSMVTLVCVSLCECEFGYQKNTIND